MPVSRMRMRPWLEQMIESETIPGLCWVDKSKTMFSIPWKHAARHGWEMDKDASLFKMWAIHTGKYSEGQASDPKTWKANFRCAMNSLPDIQEVKDKSINKGHQAMRVFKMLPVTLKSREKRIRMSKCGQKTKVKYEESSDSDSVPSPMEQTQLNFSTQDSRVDSTMHSELQDVTYTDRVEVPEWSSLVEVEFSDLTRRFEVSPSHSSCPDDNEIIEICAQWERERASSEVLSKGFLSNEPCTSPGSQWSDSSSADELDEPPQYTPMRTTDDLFSPFYPGIFSML